MESLLTHKILTSLSMYIGQIEYLNNKFAEARKRPTGYASN